MCVDGLFRENVTKHKEKKKGKGIFFRDKFKTLKKSFETIRNYK